MPSLPTPDRSPYRGRLAPSPTGLLHLGHARTFWTAAARARRAGGTLLLRRDDLDPDRSRSVYAEAMLEDLRWLGIEWQEGPDLGVSHAPYAQSARRSFYLEAWRQLVERGWAYPCRCSRRELRGSARAPHESAAAEEGDEPRYPGTCRPTSGSFRNMTHVSPEGHNWRLRVPDGASVQFTDGGLGLQRFIVGQAFGDFLIWRRDDVPAYQLACVVDDATMGVTEVVRGEDLLRSTARQLLLYGMLRVKPPAWFHCPLVVDGTGQRLAKRADALSIRHLREAGHTPAEVLAMAGVPV